LISIVLQTNIKFQTDSIGFVVTVI